MTYRQRLRNFGKQLRVYLEILAGRKPTERAPEQATLEGAPTSKETMWALLFSSVAVWIAAAVAVLREARGEKRRPFGCC